MQMKNGDFTENFCNDELIHALKNREAAPNKTKQNKSSTQAFENQIFHKFAVTTCKAPKSSFLIPCKNDRQQSSCWTIRHRASNDLIFPQIHPRDARAAATNKAKRDCLTGTGVRQGLTSALLYHTLQMGVGDVK